MEINKIYHGDCLGVLKTLEDNSIDSCVTDPPYGISFMNKHWDYDVPKVEVWQEILRVLKPGGHLLCACGTRTQHRMAVNIEDAGFEIRDVITWHYGSGFPKSLDISKQLDKQAGVEREIIKTINKAHISQGNTNEGWHRPSHLNDDGSFKTTMDITEPKTEEAKQWEGWGTALKPATEFWTLARKPISENTVAENVLKYGTGGINIDGSRIETSDEMNPVAGGQARYQKSIQEQGYRPYSDGIPAEKNTKDDTYYPNTNGRFPANVIFDEFTGKILDEQSGINESKQSNRGIGLTESNVYGKGYNDFDTIRGHDDIGGASRFFYCPKADNYERNKGCEKLPAKQVAYGNQQTAQLKKGEQLTPNAGVGQSGVIAPSRNHHPTVKPIDLMRYLVKLITPKKGICLDPYCGTGTTLIGCKLELINYVGIEREQEYCNIAEARIAAWNPERYLTQTLF